MLIIDNYDISMTRGDDVSITFNFYNQDDTEYILEDGDIVHFNVKRNVIDNSYLINKTYTNPGKNNVEIILQHSDTDKLEYGIYLYDICIVNSETYRTPIPISKFQLLEEVNTLWLLD